MRKAISTSIVIIGAVLMTTAAYGAPLMVMPETEFEFGYVPQNSEVSHVFWLYSKGDDTLKILKVVPG